MREETAVVLPFLEKPTAVRAFCAATSQLKSVASPVRKVPSTVGGTFGALGKLTTLMNACICVPMGNRIAARVIATRWAAKLMMLATSAAVSRGWPLIVPGSGSLMIG